jgi:hypothetical protein
MTSSLQIEYERPHEIHADRIIALMLNEMARKHAILWRAIYDLTKDPHLRDGSPKAQARLEAKVRALGPFSTALKPGKRGRYELRVFNHAGWSPETDQVDRSG